MTAHYEERMQADLEEIRRKVRKASELVEGQVHKALQAVLTDTVELANEVILGDRQVNRRIMELDHLCYTFIVRHAPSAGQLRYAAAVLRLDVALERVGDYAGLMGREVARLSGPPSDTILRDVELIGAQARHTLSQALRAFHEGNAELARATFGLQDQTDHTLDTLMAELLAAAEQRTLPLRDAFTVQRIVHLAKRVADQSENISEQTIFALTGKEKEPKVFRILFVDAHDDRATQMAAAYARKAFPASGSYFSAAWDPAPALDPRLVEFLEGEGVNLRQAAPTRLLPITDEPEHFHVVVCFSPEARAHLGEIPYRTTVLEWRPQAPDGMDPAALSVLYRDVAGRLQELMTILAGPDAR